MQSVISNALGYSDNTILLPYNGYSDIFYKFPEQTYYNSNNFYYEYTYDDLPYKKHLSQHTLFSCLIFNDGNYQLNNAFHYVNAYQIPSILIQNEIPNNPFNSEVLEYLGTKVIVPNSIIGDYLNIKSEVIPYGIMIGTPYKKDIDISIVGSLSELDLGIIDKIKSFCDPLVFVNKPVFDTVQMIYRSKICLVISNDKFLNPLVLLSMAGGALTITHENELTSSIIDGENGILLDLTCKFDYDNALSNWESYGKNGQNFIESNYPKDNEQLLLDRIKEIKDKIWK